MIDFAHTPNALANILEELKTMTKGRLIHVFGSAGLRDASKRPMMGKVASTYDDIIVLTAEDPRTEKLEDINREIMKGIDKKSLHVIDDRAKAIALAISMAKKGDTVVCTGKSHEKSMNYGNGEVPWDEFAVVKEALYASTH